MKPCDRKVKLVSAALLQAVSRWMKAKIARFHNPDIDDLAAHEPTDPEIVGFLL